MSSSPTALASDKAPPGRRAQRVGFRSIFDSNSFLIWGLIPVLIMVPWWTTTRHYRLPTPKVDLFSPDGQPQISEARILSHVAELTDPNIIGYRTVGTRAHALGDAWAVEQVKALVSLCDTIKAQASAEGRTVDLECEWDRQQGSGTHKFDIMNRIIYKSYQNLTNVLFRISSSRPESKTLAILLNSHLDSTLPSPGAADDALCVAMSLEIARNLIESTGKGTWEVGWGIIFLLNNAEETFQDASHLFSTQHPWAQTIRTVVNLEAAGSTGPELLFQATSEEMVYAYQNVPYPHGTVVANDIFASGIMMSDTDFRQFDQYLLVPGIDLAVVGHSYFYHTSRDTVENIEPGVAQHFAENVLEITKYMTAREKDSQGRFKEGSVLQRVKKFTADESAVSSTETGTAPAAASSMGALPFASSDMGGQQHSRRPDVVFWSLFGLRTVVYTGSTARWLYSLWALFCTLLVLVDANRTTRTSANGTPKPTSKLSATSQIAKTRTLSSNYAILLVRCSAFLLYTLLRAIAYVNIVAFIMRSVLGKQLSWFGGEWRPIWLYVWFALLGLVNTPPNVIIPSYIPSQVLERALLHASLLLNVGLAVVIQFIGIGSAALFFITSIGIGSGLAVGLVIDALTGGMEDGAVNSLVHLLGAMLPLALGCELAQGTLDVFIPLTGRMPPFVPAEHIIASLVAFFTFLSFPLPASLIHRVPQSPSRKASDNTSLSTILAESIPKSLDSVYRHHVLRSIGAVGIGAVLWFAYISGWGSWPFDRQHPKRIFISFTEDVSASSYGLHIASMDGAAGFPQLAHELGQMIASSVLPGGALATDAAEDPRKVTFDLWNTDWNSFYPLGDLFDHYSFSTTPPLPLQYSPAWKDPSRFGIKVLDDRVNEAAGTRSLKLEMRHSEIIWTVLAFDAHVLSWSIDDQPPNEYTRHHIKEASFYGNNKWMLDMVIVLNPHKPELYQERTIANGHSGTKLGSLELSFSGIIENGMWPPKKLDWEREVMSKGSLIPDSTWSIAMSFFQEIDTWMEETRKGSTDTFMIHNVVQHVTI